MIEILKELSKREKYGQKRILGKCHCGSIREYRRQRVAKGETTNCGCVNIKHGEHDSITYVTWEAMMGRCYNPKKDSYKWYGARGIEVCEAWKDYRNFRRDMGERPSKHYSIDRINPDGNYEKANCRWLLKSENTKRIYASR